jgi:hypothetical protein
MTAPTAGNEPAFPRPYSEQQPGDLREFCYASDGMTMREWFAGMALQGLLARAEFALFSEMDGNINVTVAASYAYELADAMLAQARK